MAKIVVIGLPGETGLWIADLDAGTVAPMDPPTGDALGAANLLRSGGAAVVNGVDLAIAVQSSAEAFAGKFEGFSGKFDTFSGKFDT